MFLPANKEHVTPGKGELTPKDTADGEVPTEAGEALQRLELIASYLLPLKLTDERYPVEEHARVAADVIRRQTRDQR